MIGSGGGSGEPSLMLSSEKRLVVKMDGIWAFEEYSGTVTKSYAKLEKSLVV